jgi:ADP-ribose pyrophosphatase YjhB (NUDIX family)
VHYDNPKIIVGTIATWEDKYLLCRRAIPPRVGYWTMPAGFLEIGESTREGAMRETMEEAGARVEITDLLAQYDIRRIGQVYLLFRATILNPHELVAGEESQEVRLFDWPELPWQSLAFPTVQWALEHHHQTRQQRTLVPFGNPTQGGEDPPPLKSL